MNYENNPEREQIVERALTAYTLPEIKAAAQALREWIQQHPDDVGAEDVLEPLTMLWEGLQTEAPERETTPVAAPLWTCSIGEQSRTTRQP